MKKILISIALASQIFAGGIPVIDVASIAQAVTNYLQQIKDYSMQLQQYQQLYEQLKQQIEMVRMQTQNLQSLRNYDWDDLGTILYQTRNVMNNINGMSYDVTNIIDKFNKLYKTSSEYTQILNNAPNEKTRNEILFDQYEDLLAKNQNTFKGTMQKLHLVEEDFNSETAIIAKLKQRSQTAQGALEVAQAGNDLLAYQIDEARKLRTIMMTQTSMMTNFLASQNNEEILGKTKDGIIDNKGNWSNPYENPNPNALKWK